MTKKVILILLLVVAMAGAVGVLLLNRRPTFDACVLSNNGGSLLVYKTEEDDSRLCRLNTTQAKLVGKDTKRIAAENFAPGQLVRVTHGNVVQTSFPPVYSIVHKIQVLGQADADLLSAGMAEAEGLLPLQEEDENMLQPEFFPPPADSALYRGVVEKITQPDGEVQVTLAQAPGTNYTRSKLVVRVDENTRLTFSVGELSKGDYLEVWYGAPVGGNADTESAFVRALMANRLPEASLVVYNGEIKEITQGEEKKGSLLLTALDSDEETMFHYTADTQFYLNFSELKAGDRLNIYFSGATTRSLPPQATALEVRPYYAGEK